MYAVQHHRRHQLHYGKSLKSHSGHPCNVTKLRRKGPHQQKLFLLSRTVGVILNFADAHGNLEILQ